MTYFGGDPLTLRIDVLLRGAAALWAAGDLEHAADLLDIAWVLLAAPFEEGQW